MWKHLFSKKKYEYGCGTCNIQLVNALDWNKLDLLMKYIKLVIVYLKHIQFISTITEMWFVSFIHDWRTCITLSLLVYVKTMSSKCMWTWCAIQIHKSYIQA